MALVFLYGTSLPGQPDHQWVADLPSAPAIVHGVLWRSRRSRPALAPDPDGLPIRGLLVDIDPGRLTVMDMLETAGNEAIHRAPVRAAANLRSVEAQAWVLATDHPERLGFRRIKTTDWTRVAP